jgi:hypothetical protein
MPFKVIYAFVDLSLYLYSMIGVPDQEEKGGILPVLLCSIQDHDKGYE